MNKCPEVVRKKPDDKVAAHGAAPSWKLLTCYTFSSRVFRQIA